MKTLNDFKKENKDLEKLEMATKIGGLKADPTKTITAENDSNWNCGDVETCRDVIEIGGGTVIVCDTTPLPDTGGTSL